VEEELGTFWLGEVFWDTRPNELAGGVSHAAADDEALGSGLFLHFAEEVGVEICWGVSY